MTEELFAGNMPTIEDPTQYFIDHLSENTEALFNEMVQDIASMKRLLISCDKVLEAVYSELKTLKLENKHLEDMVNDLDAWTTENHGSTDWSHEFHTWRQGRKRDE